ncbi:hypothetical protein Ahy_B06g080464 isoform B [Arachis hypogaea]|uniref:Uncharacterized protein n=1 Tax=Arachis hypogaea TaxID=3818 RepID=A0A444YHZ4_ARAHY|nr:hypothetical protein Ahy_B06g080464 isoform B [Arachis hypogaea]
MNTADGFGAYFLEKLIPSKLRSSSSRISHSTKKPWFLSPRHKVLVKNVNALLEVEMDFLDTCWPNYIISHFLGGDDLLNENGLAKASNFSNYWKGKNNLYCVGLAHRGFFGASNDAQNKRKKVC